jgi:hypothetical protein
LSRLPAERPCAWADAASRSRAAWCCRRERYFEIAEVEAEIDRIETQTLERFAAPMAASAPITG